MTQLQLVEELPGHSEPAWSVTFNPTRSLLASCSTDRTIRLYSYILPSSESSSSTSQDSAKPVFSLLKKIETEHKKSIRSIAWSPDGRSLASASFDSTVGLWEEVIPLDQDNEGDEHQGVFRPEAEEIDEESAEKEWECVTTLEGHESECKSVGFSNDGALLASCSRDKSVWVWEVQPDADFECIAVMMEHSQDVKCIAWHPHEEILASASYDSHIHLAFDDPDGDWITFAHLHPKFPARPLTIPSTSSQHLISALLPSDKEREVESTLSVPPLEEDETVWCLAWSPCGRYLASGGDNGGIRIWARRGTNPDSPFEEIIHTAAHSRSVFSLSWSPSPSPSSSASSSSAPETETEDLGLLASAGGDGKIIIWSLTKPSSRSSTSPSSTTAAPGKQVEVEIRPIAAVKEAHGVNDINSVNWCLRDDKKGLGMLASAGDEGGIRVWRLVSE